MTFPTMWFVQRAYAQTDQSLCWSLEYSRSIKILAEHYLEFLSLKGGCAGSSESTLATSLEITCHGSYFLVNFCVLHSTCILLAFVDRELIC